jgi:hypothetical protein
MAGPLLAAPHRIGALLAVLAATSACTKSPTKNHHGKPPARTARLPATAGFQIPVEYYKLDNGLRVVLSPTPPAPP